jgi:hypothetical protein
MAAPADKSVRAQDRADASIAGELATLRAEFNKLVTNVRILCTKLDADAGVTDTNYFALVMDSAATGPSKVNVSPG